GAGGLSLGLQAAGFRTQYAFDFDRYAIETYRNNISAAVECVDAGNILAAEVLRRHGLVRGECVLVAGGPPCQGFSQQGIGNLDDRRNSLVLWYADFIVGIRPTFFILENVSYIMSRRGRAVFEEFSTRMESSGYVLYRDVLDAADFGVAQTRKRAIVVG